MVEAAPVTELVPMSPRCDLAHQALSRAPSGRQTDMSDLFQDGINVPLQGNSS